MPVKSNVVDVIKDLNKISRNLAKTVNPILVKTAVETKKDIQSDWPNPANSGPQASGRPSESTGHSQKAWRRRVDKFRVVVFNNANQIDRPAGKPRNLKYSRYVHFTGDKTGQAVEDARQTFVDNFLDIDDDLTKTIAKQLNTVGK